MNLVIDSTVKNVLVSVISGISVSFLLLIIKRLWTNTLFPWFENLVYRDLKIEGQWYGLYTDLDTIRKDIIKIDRKGHAIEGTLRCISEPEQGEEYLVKGTFKNLILSLTYETSDKSKTDRGSLTLMSKNNGLILRGKIAFYNNGQDSIEYWNVFWFRKQEDLDKMIKNLEINKKEYSSIINRKGILDKDHLVFYSNMIRYNYSSTEESTDAQNKNKA